MKALSFSRIFFCIFLIVAVCSSVRADVFVPGEPLFVPPKPSFSQVRLLLSEVRSLVIPKGALVVGGESALKPIYEKLLNDLEAKSGSNDFSVEDAVKLGGVFIRLNMHSKSVPVLEKALRQCDENSEWYAPLSFNLAMAYAADDLLLDRSITYQRQGLAALTAPRKNQSFSAWQQQRRLEIIFLKWFQEKLFQRDRKKTFSIGTLFGNLEEQWQKSDYPVKPVSMAFQDQLPPDALESTFRLVLAFPMDNQLYWLFGEMLLIQGDPQSASSVLDELVNARQMSSSQVLFDHSRKLKRFLEQSPPKEEIIQKEQSIPEQGSGKNDSSSVPPGIFMGDLRYLLVGFLSGILVCYLMQLQLKQWFRKS